MTNYLIDFDDNAAQSAIDSYFSTNACTVLKTYSNLNKVFLVSCAIQPPASLIITSIINDDAAAITLLGEQTLLLPSSSANVTVDTAAQKDWWKTMSVLDIDFNSASASVPVYGDKTNVYILDSGIDIAHPEFTGKNVELVHSFTGEFADTNGHGTALASVIVGNTCGLTNATVKVVKIFDSATATKQSDMLAAFDAVIDNALLTPNRFSVVNLSWSIPRNSYIESKILHLVQAGFAIVVSAGNSGTEIQNVTPAAMPEVQTIGAFNADFRPCSFSNYTPDPALSLTQNDTNSGALDSWAPGENIYCAVPGGGYTTQGAGTSLAAAIYSGCLAYNASQYLKPTDESLITYFRSEPGSNSCGALNFKERQGLLILDNPKYASSVNRICTYLQLPLVGANYTRPRHEKLVARAGKMTMFKFLYPSQATSYEILSALPPFITFDFGFIYVNALDEPINPNGVDFYDIDYRVTTTSGQVINDVLRIVILASAFDPATLPPNDPLIDISLEATCIPATNCTTGCGAALLCDWDAGMKNCVCL